ncbi:hypothetical protein O181_000152 [Austropuccinia psidii MF-1]|uniref:Uncharacterized protein n=1 Tax=Austropuccinia psidii MF-1 TaxID=1389203 RepID=A0A9Q3GBR5_9BASI|nr:hypothetical protein [Austropuccinia psidii MF-1]
MNDMEDITTRTEIGRNWYEMPIDNEDSGKQISRPKKPQDRACLKFHKCGSKSHLANRCPKKTRINDIEVETGDNTKGTDYVSQHESDSRPS